MCAGLVMRQAGKSVLILEKTGLVGGSTAKAGGVMWIPANRFMAEAGVEDSLEKGEEYLNAVVEAQPGGGNADETGTKSPGPAARSPCAKMRNGSPAPFPCIDCLGDLLVCW